MKGKIRKLLILLVLILLAAGTVVQAALLHARKFRVLYLVRNDTSAMPLREYVNIAGEEGFTPVYDRTWVLKEGGTAFYDVMKREWFVDSDGREYTAAYRTWREYSDFFFEEPCGRSADGCSGMEAFEWARSILGYEGCKVYSVLCTVYLEPTGALYGDRTLLTVRCEDMDGEELFREEQVLTAGKGWDIPLNESLVEGYSVNYALLTTRDIWGAVHGELLAGNTAKLRYDQTIQSYDLLCVLEALPPEETEEGEETTAASDTAEEETTAVLEETTAEPAETGESTEPLTEEYTEPAPPDTEPQPWTEPVETTDAATAGSAPATEPMTSTEKETDPGLPSEHPQSAIKESKLFKPLVLGGGAGLLFIAAALLLAGGRKKR